MLDPSDTSRPVGLNPLARAGKSSALIADDILGVFRKLYGSYFGPRTQDILHAGLLTLMTVPNMSLCALPALYTDAEFRSRLVARTKSDPLGLGSFWQWYEGLSPGERNTAIAPVMNKLRAFLLRPSIRLVMGQGAPKFAISDVFTKRKVLLVNLAKGSLGPEASQLFGSLVVSQVWQAAQGRANIPPERRRPAFVYVDEMQDYLSLPTDIGDVLAQARGYGVGLILAHQNLGQLPRDLKSGIMANARSRVCFQLEHDDAYIMAKRGELLTPGDFEKLPVHHIYAKLVHNGQVSDWMSGETLPPSEPTSDPSVLRQLSRERYGMAASEVEAELRGIISRDAHTNVPVTATESATIGRKKLGLGDIIDNQISYRDILGRMS